MTVEFICYLAMVLLAVVGLSLLFGPRWRG
jgi:hypothetical protein